MLSLLCAGVFLYLPNSEGPSSAVDANPSVSEKTPIDESSLMLDSPSMTPEDEIEPAEVPDSATVVIDPYGFGFGVADLFDDAKTAIPAFEGALGPPDSDTTGPCLGSDGPNVRTLRWADFAVSFSEGAESSLIGFSINSFQAEGAKPTGIKTAEGIGLGSSVAEVKSAYAQATFFEGYMTGFVLNEEASPTLRGAVSELSDTGEVTALFVTPEGCEGE